jgi:hypothetical protein
VKIENNNNMSEKMSAAWKAYKIGRQYTVAEGSKAHFCPPVERQQGDRKSQTRTKQLIESRAKDAHLFIQDTPTLLIFDMHLSTVLVCGITSKKFSFFNFPFHFIFSEKC